MRSPNQRAAPTAMKMGATAPMIVALATLVRRKAPNVIEMSAAKNTPPSAHARIVSHRRRRPVAYNTPMLMTTPHHSRHEASASVGRSTSFTSSGAKPHAIVV